MARRRAVTRPRSWFSIRRELREFVAMVQHEAGGKLVGHGHVRPDLPVRVEVGVCWTCLDVCTGDQLVCDCCRAYELSEENSVNVELIGSAAGDGD